MNKNNNRNKKNSMNMEAELVSSLKEENKTKAIKPKNK